MPKKRLVVADLFCGAGGTSTGITQFCAALGIKLDLIAVNHWDRAVETHAVNHPKAHHFCQDLTRLKPIEAVRGGKLDLLVASPECTHHSNARGGKPKSDQSRASAWVVLEWVNALQIDRVLIENVPEFLSWGPLGSKGEALKSKRGETFEAFVKALEASGYRVAWKLLNSADYGAATSRKRLFIQAAKGRREILWPKPSHERNPQSGLFGSLPRWRAAREVIGWNYKGESIFTRKRPLSENTLKRIEAGLRKFGGEHAEPFLMAMNYLKERGNDARAAHSLNDPLPTVTSQGNRFAFILPQFSNAEPRSTDRPIPTITTTSRGMAFITCTGQPNANGSYVYSADQVLPTVTTSDQHALVEPFLVDMRGTSPEALEATARNLDESHPTITAGGSHTALVEPFVCKVATSNQYGLCEPFILPHRQFKQMDVDSVGQPLRTVTAQNGACNALVIPFYGNGQASSLDKPLPTATTKDRFGLASFGVDIRFRMLQPSELAAAMGFPSDYKITGNRSEQVRQVGNAVEVNQARALAVAVFGSSK